MADLATVATYLARRGWAIYPQAPESNVPRANCATCKNGGCDWRSGKCPCLISATSPCHALHAATSDVELTRSRWEHAPRCNPAMHLGKSNLVVLDLDCHGDTPPDTLAPGLPNPGVSNGIGAFTVLLDHLGVDWPEDTLTVESPTGGMHLYYQAPRTPLRHCLAAWQVEVKAGACSITAPGSVRRLDDGSTGTYRRVSTVAEPAPFPRWLGEWLVSTGRIADPTARHSTPTRMHITGRHGNHSPAWWDRVWQSCIDGITHAPAGGRNDAMARHATRLLEVSMFETGCPWTVEQAKAALVDAQHSRPAGNAPDFPGEYRAHVDAIARGVAPGRRAAA